MSSAQSSVTHTCGGSEGCMCMYDPALNPALKAGRRLVDEDIAISLQNRVLELARGLGMAIYHADNLQRYIDKQPVRDLAESRAGLDAARSILGESR